MKIWKRQVEGKRAERARLTRTAFPLRKGPLQTLYEQRMTDAVQEASAAAEKELFSGISMSYATKESIPTECTPLSVETFTSAVNELLQGRKGPKR